MRSALRNIVSFLALIFGAGILSPLVQANWQEWAKQTGNDQYLVKYADLVMSKMAELAASSWFVFATGFFVGGAICLWLDYLLRTRPTAAPATIVSSTPDLAYVLHLDGTAGVHVGVDKHKKNVQFGFNLINSSGAPLRYLVLDATSAVDGKVSMTQNFVNRGGVVAKDGRARFLCMPIPYSLTKKGATATAYIRYQYGPAGPDEPPVREAVYRAEISINANGGSAYVLTEENDAEI